MTFPAAVEPAPAPLSQRSPVRSAPTSTSLAQAAQAYILSCRVSDREIILLRPDGPPAWLLLMQGDGRSYDVRWSPQPGLEITIFRGTRRKAKRALADHYDEVQKIIRTHGGPVLRAYPDRWVPSVRSAVRATTLFILGAVTATCVLVAMGLSMAAAPATPPASSHPASHPPAVSSALPRIPWPGGGTLHSAAGFDLFGLHPGRELRPQRR